MAAAPAGERAPTGERPGRIVVGVDGSAAAAAALAWAVGQARLTGAVIDAVIVWEFPVMFGYRLPVPEPDWADLAARALTAAIAHVRADGVEIRPKIVEGNAAQVLLEESAGAQMLVVGSRGHGGFVGALLGSVGQQCVHHASCPVVVIRDPVAGKQPAGT